MPIFGDWTEEYDDDSGQKYYVNEVTGETLWDLPADVAAEFGLGGQIDEPEIETVNDETVDTSPWREETTEDGEVYYINLETNETQWDPPTGWGDKEDEEELPLDPAEDPQNWEEVEGEEGGDNYWFNTVTEDTQWDKPDCVIFYENQLEDNANDEEDDEGFDKDDDDTNTISSNDHPGNVSDEDGEHDLNYEYEAKEEETVFARITNPKVRSSIVYYSYTYSHSCFPFHIECNIYRLILMILLKPLKNSVSKSLQRRISTTNAKGSCEVNLQLEKYYVGRMTL
jgi:hypothetical protein